MAPRVRIPAHVFGYTLATIPGVAYALYWRKNHKSDEDHEQILMENQANKALIQGSRDKKQDMVKFFEGMKGGDSQQEIQMRQVLYGGKGDIKRHYRVDEKLYGTEEGARMAAEEQEAHAKAAEDAKKKRKRKGKKKRKKIEEDVNPSQVEERSGKSSHTGLGITKSAIASGTAGAIALVTLLLVGGKRSQ